VGSRSHKGDRERKQLKTFRRGWGTRISAAIVAVTLVSLALGGAPPSAQAHAQYVRSQPEENSVVPQAPIEVLIWFTEAVEIGYSETQVVDATGARVDNGDTHVHFDPTNPGVTMQPNLPNGTYTVIWRVLSSVDGHRTAGTFAFSIGAPSAPSSTDTPVPTLTIEDVSAPPRWLAVTNRWLSFGGMAALIGAVFFPLLVLPAGLRAIRADDHDLEAVARSASRVIRWTVVAALVVITVTTALSLWLQAWSATGQTGSLSALQDVWTETRFGEVFTFRVSVLIGAIMLSTIALSRLPGLIQRQDLREAAWLCLAVAALALPLTTSLNSHSAAERSNTELYVISDWLHLVAGGVWIGGLLQLVLLSPAILSVTDRRAAFFAGIIPRFSLVAVASVAVVVATGVLQWWNFVGGISAVFDTDWGYILAVKVALLLPLLSLAAFNLLVVRPRFVSFVLGGLKAASERILRWERRFRWAVTGEVGLAAAILVAAALLTETTIPTSSSAGDTNGISSTAGVPTPSGLAQSVRADDLDISLDVSPGIAGQNELNIFLNDADGDDRAVQNVIVRFKYLDESLGENEDFAEPYHPPSHYVLSTSQMSLTGSWEIEVLVRREGLLDARGTFTVQITT
jgi:copper transport protein